MQRAYICRNLYFTLPLRNCFPFSQNVYLGSTIHNMSFSILYYYRIYIYIIYILILLYIFLSLYSFMCMHAQCTQLCSTLHDPMDCSSPGSTVHGILQARILEWVAMPSSKGSFQLRDRTHASCVSCIAGWILC